MIRSLVLVPFALVLLTLPTLAQEEKTTAEARVLLEQLKGAIEDADLDKAEPLAKEIKTYPEELKAGFDRYLAAQWKDVAEAYRKQYEKSAVTYVESTKVMQKQKLEESRDRLQEIHASVNNLKEGLELVAELDQLFRDEPVDLTQEDAVLDTLSKRAHFIGQLVNLTSTQNLDVAKLLQGDLPAISRPQLDLSRDEEQVLEENEKLAEQIPEPEARGIAQMNRWRIYMGKNPLLIDVKLCEASRDHSKDMATEKFFSHTSPVKGKKSPWDRASNFGTKADAENIAINGSPGGANRAWFTSTGHFKNMFASHKKIGYGIHGRHHTQMFH